jgi:hypothetical protein
VTHAPKYQGGQYSVLSTQHSVLTHPSTRVASTVQTPCCHTRAEAQAAATALQQWEQATNAACCSTRVLQELQPRRALASLLPLTLAACLLAWHAATPLLPVLLRPGPQSWTSEALPAPLHGAMHNKDGWLYLVAEEEGGKVLELLPETDRLLAVAQLDAVMSGPQALLAYAARLQVVFGAAGRKLTAVKAVSCYR